MRKRLPISSVIYGINGATVSSSRKAPIQAPAARSARSHITGLHPDFAISIYQSQKLSQRNHILSARRSQAQIFQILRHLFCHGVKGADNPLIFGMKRLREFVLYLVSLEIHPDKTRCVPNLIGKIPAGGYLFIRETDIISRTVPRNHRKAQCIRAILVDNLQWIDPLPSDFDIFLPCASRTSPWKNTVWNGTSPICSKPEKIIRATQKK